MSRLIYTVALALVCLFSAIGQTTGPKSGHLIIAGGALRDTAVFNKFIELAGGKEKANVVVIPTAGGYDVDATARENLTNQWISRGAAKVTILHTTDPNEADTQAFAAAIDAAGGVYFPGGRQWRLADAYLNTIVQTKLFDLLDRGGVIGGSSAGATIQGSYLARGDTKTNTIMVGDHEEGFGFIKNIAIDQHTLARNRQFDMFEVLNVYPTLLGISIDENTAMLISGNSFEVIGQSYVLIYDGTHWDQSKGEFVKNKPNQERFHLLRKGGRYDMKKRAVIR
ncbi:cyanophycinase [Roseivirga pacifica]|uniref:cyanophycinase n=1 Tax=Roseivirga pacifica TaxID=1267423 RepID=UPI002094945C|nr:cyanophycinase [Roseivirga pacifica]MCO6357165.1 peptidase S51 [Roseivirga pacifica]MCO6368121.1 peptidase S51 [Roseivirga pacifica]MCO6369397.1 peptidase S51 [Roseivirga pacifica]MCO6373251.1 peptidase S51 [Roseivirga pacifica]MCO6377492.1 peptidase S51 [Roseivirga pacifica]